MELILDVLHLCDNHLGGTARITMYGSHHVTRPGDFLYINKWN